MPVWRAEFQLALGRSESARTLAGIVAPLQVGTAVETIRTREGRFMVDREATTEQAMDIRMFKYEGPIQALIVSEREYGEARDIRMSKYEGPIQALIASERE